MAATPDYNKPRWANPIDTDIDAIRNNYTFLMCQVATGIPILPGWATTVDVATNSNYAKPDGYVLSHPDGRKIYVNLTWSGTLISQVTLCYDDGVSSGKVCFDPVTLTVSTSAFDDALAALNPQVNYTFKDSSYATTIIDEGSAGINLTSQNATAASNGSPMRTTRSKSLLMPANTGTNWATEAAHYTDTANAFGLIQKGLTNWTVIWSYSVANNASTNVLPFYRLGTNFTASTGEGFHCYIEAVATGLVVFHERHTSGAGVIKTSAGPMDDGANHLCIARCGSVASGLRLTHDTTIESNLNYNHTSDTSLSPFNLGGLNVAIHPGAGFGTDCFAFFNSFLSDAQVANLASLYAAEKI